MVISIIGYSNVVIYVAKPNNDDENYDTIYIDENLIFEKGEKTKTMSASRSYSGCRKCIRAIEKYAKVKDIKFFMIPIECDGFIISNYKTVETEEFLKKVVDMLKEEDESELEEKYGLDGWDVEFTEQLYEVFKVCNDRGVMEYC